MEDKAPESVSELREIAEQLRKILAQIDTPKGKDVWDKLSVVAALASGVVIAIVGGAFTYYQHQGEVLQQQAEANRGREEREAQRQLGEMDLLVKMVPLLSSPDSLTRRYATLALRSVKVPNQKASGLVMLGDFAKAALNSSLSIEERTKAAQQVVSIAKNADDALKDKAVKTLAAIAASPDAVSEVRAIAFDALKDMRLMAVEKVKSHIEGQQVARQIDEVILHSTYVPSSADYSRDRGLSMMKNIGSYQREQFGGQYIGWHYAIAPDGNILTGEQLNSRAIHAQQHNKNSISVMLILNGDKEAPTLNQKRAAGTVLKQLCRRFSLDTSRVAAAGQGIHLHREYSPQKSCPGTLIQRADACNWMQLAL